jgi:hypothetical protein
MSIVLESVTYYNIASSKLYVILTDECLSHRDKKLCDVGASLGTDAIIFESFIMSTELRSEWEKTASPTHVFESEISRLLRVALHNETDSRSRRLRELVLAEKLTKNQEQFLDTLLPLVKIRLYVAPCTCLLMTAIEMCTDLRTRYVQAIIRPDHRLRSTCCSGQNGIQRMREIADRIRGGHGLEPPEDYDPDFMDQFDNIDLTYVESMIFKDDDEQTKQLASFSSTNEPFGFELEDPPSDLLILIGEARVLGPEMVKRPFRRRARIPKQSEVYVSTRLRPSLPDDVSHMWKFKGRFTSRSNYQWSSLDPALNAGKESSPPPPPLTASWSIETQVQEQEPPSTVSVSVPGSLNA